MPHKKKRLFTKHNSTKFVLYTEGRDEDGNKITENVLVPVSHNHVPGSSLLIQKMAGACHPDIPNFDNAPSTSAQKSPSSKTRQISKSSSEKDADLEDILNQMDNDVEIDDEETDSDEEYEAVKSKIKNITFVDDLKNLKYDPSRVQVEIEEGSDFSDEFEAGQFSDASSEEESSSEDESPLLPKSMSSRIASSKTEDCPESIKILNDCFEKVLLEEYDDNQIGPLDDEEICGAFSTENEQLNHLINTPLVKQITDVEIGVFEESLKQKILEYSEIDFPEKMVEVEFKKPIEWDCESILSTYSNKYNHPTTIREEPKVRRPRTLANPLQLKLTKSKLRQLEEEEEGEEEEEDRASVATTLHLRPKGETPEERRARKNMFKEMKKECRILKKENKIAFKNEKKTQIKQEMGNRNNRFVQLC